MRVLDHGAGEDVLTAERALGVAVLARLGCANFEDLAGLGLQDCVASLAKSRGLTRESQRCACVAGCLRVLSVCGRFGLEGYATYLNGEMLVLGESGGHGVSFYEQ